MNPVTKQRRLSVARAWEGHGQKIRPSIQSWADGDSTGVGLDLSRLERLAQLVADAEGAWVPRDGIAESPWARFLGARAELIHKARTEGESDAGIARWLSADPGQVGLIAATPLRAIVCTREWMAERAPSRLPKPPEST